LGIQTVITRTVTVAGGRFAPGHLGELTQLVPFEMVDEALAQTNTVQSRIRALPSRVVVYLLLAACLFPELGYPGVWAKLTAGLSGLPVAAPTAGALAQARRRAGVAPLRFLFDLLRGPAALPGGAGTWWRGMLICAIDGTTLTVPDSPANLARFTKGGGHHGGTGYPQADCWPWWRAGPAPSSTPCSTPPPAVRRLCHRPSAQRASRHDGAGRP
jgi:Insertion element 4 transposase N-terminal